MSTTTAPLSPLPQSSTHLTKEQRLLDLIKAARSSSLLLAGSRAKDKIEATPINPQEPGSALYTRPTLARPELPEQIIPSDDSSDNCLKKLAISLAASFTALSDAAIGSTTDLVEYQVRSQKESRALLDLTQMVKERMTQLYKDQKTEKANEDSQRFVTSIIGVVIGAVTLALLVGGGIYSVCNSAAAAAEAAAAEVAEAAESTVLEVTEEGAELMQMGKVDAGGANGGAGANGAPAAADDVSVLKVSDGPAKPGADVSEAAANADKAANASKADVSLTSTKWWNAGSQLFFSALAAVSPSVECYYNKENSIADQKVADAINKTDANGNSIGGVGQPTAAREMCRYLIQFTQSASQRKSSEPSNLNQMAGSILSTVASIFQNYQSVSQDFQKMG